MSRTRRKPITRTSGAPNNILPAGDALADRRSVANIFEQLTMAGPLQEWACCQEATLQRRPAVWRGTQLGAARWPRLIRVPKDHNVVSLCLGGELARPSVLDLEADECDRIEQFRRARVTLSVCEMLYRGVTFEQFVRRHGSRLRAALVATYGPDLGADAAAEALAYGFEHWSALESMHNPAGYLYRVGQTEARRQLRPSAYLPARPIYDLPAFEPALAPALESLTDPQRVGVILVHALGWSQVDTAEVLGIDVSTLRTHIARGMAKLRIALEVTTDAH